MSHAEQNFRAEAARCRRLAADINDPDVRAHLMDMAREYDRRADAAGAPETTFTNGSGSGSERDAEA